MPNPSTPNKPQDNKRRRRLSRFGQQMAEKQELKKIYGVREEQLRKYYEQARTSKEETGSTLISLMERRLDNAVFRAGFAETRPQARQLSTHRIFSVNGTPTDIPSRELKPGDVVSMRENKRGKVLFENLAKHLENVDTPSWIQLDAKNYSFKINNLPEASDANLPIDIRAIVEYFAR